MISSIISMAELRPPRHAVRSVIDEGGIRDLAESVRKVGVLEPIIVERVEGGYEVIAGHRRFLAAAEAKLDAVPCLVREANDETAVAIKVHENLYREELSPVEEAAFYAELFAECGSDVDRVSALVRQSRSYVERRLLLMSGDPAVLQAIAVKSISLGVAEQLNAMKRADDRAYYLNWAVRVGATIETVRDWRRHVELRRQVEEQEGKPPEPAPPAAAVEAVAVRCFICGSEEAPWDFEFHHIHRSCRILAERLAEERMAAEGAKA